MSQPAPEVTAAVIAKPSKFNPTTIDRPDPALLKYYVISSLLSGPFLPLVLLPLYFKYVTLKYKFDDEGVSMSWGILFRREIHLTYRRIQDIHLNRNIVQRWLGLATVGIQTASGSATPEMSIEGILEAEALRDYLYAKMRGARSDHEDHEDHDSENEGARAKSDEVYTLLSEIRDAMRVIAKQERAAGEEGRS